MNLLANKLRIWWLLAGPVLLWGCAAAPKPEPQISQWTRPQEINIVLIEQPTPVDATALLLLGNPVSGTVVGALVGFLGGLHPYTWMFGGPYVTTPLGAAAGLTCGAQLLPGTLKVSSFRRALDNARVLERTRQKLSIPESSGPGKEPPFVNHVVLVRHDTGLTLVHAARAPSYLEVQLAQLKATMDINPKTGRWIQCDVVIELYAEMRVIDFASGHPILKYPLKITRKVSTVEAGVSPASGDDAQPPVSDSPGDPNAVTDRDFESRLVEALTTAGDELATRIVQALSKKE